MAQGYGLQKVGVQTQVPAYGPGHAGDHLDMEDPMGYMVVFQQVKNLGLINIAGIGLGVEYAVHIQSPRPAMVRGLQAA
jgi:hypothetical protein